MNTLPSSIADFILGNQLASICFVDDQHLPYCITCFYILHEDSITLVIKSSPGTKHEAFTASGIKVAGTIQSADKKVLWAKGIQFTGTIIGEEDLSEAEKKAYLKGFKLASLVEGYLWGIKLEWIKFTDNKIALGHKTTWKLLVLLVFWNGWLPWLALLH